MRAKDFLERANKCRAIIANRLDEIQRYTDMAESITAAMDGIRVTSSRNIQDRMAEAVTMAADAAEQLIEDVNNYNVIIREINHEIEKLPTLYYQVLHGVYIQGKYLSDVAIDLDKSYSAITTANGRAQKALQDMLDAEEVSR